MNQPICLNDIAEGETAIVSSLTTVGSMRRRLLDLGVIEQTSIECIGSSPSGNPRAYRIRGAIIAIRRDDCSTILIEPIHPHRDQK